MKYWVNVVSKDHLKRGIAGGFMQANHGKPHALKNVSKGDWVVFYSPKTAFVDGEPLQAFTAIAQVTDDEAYQTEVLPDFQPWRRCVEFKPSHETPIKPLIDQFEFIQDKTHWGFKLRFGFFEVNRHDFELINEMMTGAM